MGSGEVVEALPLGQFGLQIDVILVAEELVELLLIGSVRPLYLAIELGRAWLDVSVTDALVFDVPVEFCLELMWNSCGTHGRCRCGFP